MGRTTRWLKYFLGGGGKKENRASKENGSCSVGEERGEKKRWSFKSGRDLAEANSNQAPVPEDTAAWLHTIFSESEKQQNKHAIAVAEATAAAADAAVAAAQAAIALARLTRHGRSSVTVLGDGGVQERLAAVKIQTVFRGYLAKKALRALKALVKLQALVRGYLVRKQAAAMLHSMQALIRAQATVRAQKCRSLLSNDDHHRWFNPETIPLKSTERFEDARSDHLASVHSRRLSANHDTATNGYDRSPKIVEIDTCRSKSRSSLSRTSPSLLDSTEDMTVNSVSSPLPPRQIPARISIPDYRDFQDYEWCYSGDRCRFSSTAQSTPSYMSSAGIAPPATSTNGLFRRFLNLPNCPNYMSNTRSFEAKVRSQSAPKQRPEAAVGPRRMLPLSEVLLDSRPSLSGVGMQRSCTRVQQAFNYFKSAAEDRLDRSLELGRETERDFYLQRKW